MVTQYRWVLVYYHAMKECGREYGDIWYDSKEECQQAAEALSFDYCCGYDFEYETREKTES